MAASSSLDRIRRHLVGLKMPRALETLESTLARIEQGEVSALEAIETLLGEELTTRETRRIKMALMTARLTTIKTLASYDFSFQPSLDRNADPGAGRSSTSSSAGKCVHFLGPAGNRQELTWRSPSAWRRSRPARACYFATLADLVASLRSAERDGSLRERVRYLSRHSLLIVDEIGYLPVGASGGNLFFQLVNACYERCAMILTSNRGFGEWAEIFGDAVVATALLDRLLHHAVVIAIEGNSYRLREHADLVPEHLRSRPIPKVIELPEPKRRRGRPPKEST